jgi:hypothetical protein
LSIDQQYNILRALYGLITVTTPHARVERYLDVDVDAISCTRDLCKLPALAKEVYRRSFMFEDLAVSDTEYITHTTGTTGALTWRHRSLAEASVIRELFGQQTGQLSKDLTLAFRYDHHGMAMPMPGRARGIPIGVNDEIQLKQSVQMLTASYHFADGMRHPTIVAGTGHDVALLAQAWLEAQTANEPLGIHT